MRRRLLLIVNPAAGVAKRKLLERTLAALARRGAVVTETPAGTAEEASLRIKEAILQGTADAIVAAGGDGTFRQAAIAAAGSDIPVGLIPMGTGNVLANEIGLPRSADRLADTLVNGRVVEIEGGTVNGAPFFLWVGVGFDARAVAALSQPVKRRIGKAAYVLPGLRAFAAGCDALEVDADGRKMHAGWVIITNASRYGGLFTLSHKTAVTEPGLVAVVVHETTRAGLLKALLALSRGRLGAMEDNKSATQLPARHITIKAPTPVPVQVDGDLAGTTPVDIFDRGPRVKLIVPA